MRRFKVCLLLFNFLAAKHYLVEVDEDEDVATGSDYSLGHDTELLYQKRKKMLFFSCLKIRETNKLYLGLRT